MSVTFLGATVRGCDTSIGWNAGSPSPYTGLLESEEFWGFHARPEVLLLALRRGNTFADHGIATRFLPSERPLHFLGSRMRSQPS